MKFFNKIKRSLRAKKRKTNKKFKNKFLTSCELFHAHQMERHSEELALSHRLTKKNKPGMLLKRLAESEAILARSCNLLADKKHDGFSPGREWLLDNYYVIQEEIFAIRRYLPEGYGSALPQLVGDIPGYPRVYDITREIIEHNDGRWDEESLSGFIDSYQKITKLTLAELWAIPITLGVALIENLSHASERIVADRDHCNLANEWVSRMERVAVTEPNKLVMIIADMARSDPPMSSAFVAELARRLQGAALSLPLSWLEEHLSESGLTIEQLVAEENRCQAAHQVSVSNNITSLRRLAAVDWRDFVEKVSVVEKALLLDPVGVYEKMDFSTRDRYRHVIENLARRSDYTEQEIAVSAVKLAKSEADKVSPGLLIDPDVMRRCHVGYYLINKGQALLRKELNLRYSFWQLCKKFARHYTKLSYHGSIVLITAGLTYVLLRRAFMNGLIDYWLVPLAFVVVICASQFALALVNLISTLLARPKLLARIDFTDGIPVELSSLVVVPAMLTNKKGIESLVDALEVRFLSNQDPNLYFMLLTDFNDAQTEHMPQDNELLELIKVRINDLNKRYAVENKDIFFLCHRPRQWNDRERVWMGRERKRGKLSDLNKLLRGVGLDAFSFIVGRIELLPKIKSVITLDVDTQLPRDSAHQLVGTMAHPLNRPIYDSVKKIVVAGHGILQPRMAEALSDEGQTRYVSLCGNEFGIDPYTRTVSDIYQDLFNEGSYIGKGIYDVDLFDQVLGERFPDNQILSHDLLEGCYLRSGYISDVPLYETSPRSYLSDSKRRSRWIRGDWQLIRWLWPTVLDNKKSRVHNPLSLLSKLKLLDNLRRSLVPIALLLLFVLSWTVLSTIYFWIGVVLGVVILPVVMNNFLDLLRKPKDTLTRQHVANVIHATYRCFGQLVLYVACLPYEAWYSFMAISRTLWRIAISRRHLLEWVPYDQVDKSLKDTWAAWIIAMWPAPTLALIALIIFAIDNKLTHALFMSPILILWFVSPAIARWLSHVEELRIPKLSSGQLRFLHVMARKTWDFFDTFMTDENHWLPPDNYQEKPVEVLAQRTSPTNIGLSLLANLTAYDFGYITLTQFLDRTNKTLQSMSKLERYRGHFYNWYNTQTLEPLAPRYVSTVDSGNLAGHLLVLRQGLLALSQSYLLNIRYLNGLRDTYYLMTEQYKKTLPPELEAFQKILDNAKQEFTDWSSALACCNGLCEAAKKITSLNNSSVWSHKLLEQCEALSNEIGLYVNVPMLDSTSTLQDLLLMQSDASSYGKDYVALINELAQKALSFSYMDMSFLYDKASHLSRIGFNVDEQRKDRSSYDLLSSEARLGTFVAIAQGQIAQESWFALGRLLVATGKKPTLISWSGSMFEYLMPLLVMPTYTNTLLDQTYHSSVQRQISYGNERGVPWGVSESGFNALDIEFNYLYRAFGVPGLGLKRGLEDDLVIAPYASVMSLMVDPEAACSNLQRLAAEKVVGQFGFYEAIDYTPSRLPPDSKKEIIRSFMAHHQGMSFLALSYFLHDQPMQKRFMEDSSFQATLLLLQERIPKPTASYLQIPKPPSWNVVHNNQEVLMREFKNPNTHTPQVQLLSNGRYHVMLSQAGGGYSRWNDIAITRWREDSTLDNWGFFGYVRDVDSNEFWSTCYQPRLGSDESFKTVFSEAHVEYHHHEKWFDMRTEVAISPEDDVELRRVRIHNLSKNRRTIDFTTYAEVVLAPQMADLAQPTFSNLFVETEILPEQHAILATRRPQDDKQNSPWMCHILNIHNVEDPSFSFETDRAKFVGRDRNLMSPLALTDVDELSNTQGSVLDPIISIRCKVVLEPHAIITFDILTGVAGTRADSLALVEKYQDRRLANRVFGLAWTHSQVLLHHLNVSEEQAQLYGKLASAIIYASKTRRAIPTVLASNRQGQSGLWKYSISGDVPIVLLFIEDVSNIELVHQLIQAQAYWRSKGLIVDIVILNREHISYRQNLQDQIMGLITNTANKDNAGNIIVRFEDQISLEDLVLLQTVARIILSDDKGTLKEQLKNRHLNRKLPPLLTTRKVSHNVSDYTLPALSKELQFYNGLGGFTSKGDEYVIRLAPGAATPAPWINVLANPYFGTLVSESGQGYTWTENSHEFRLTPWYNDPIQDLSGEVFYLRDDQTGHVWSPSVLPCRGQGDYQTRHGFGFTVFEHMEEGIYSELWNYVALDAPVKFFRLKLRNDSSIPRTVSATGCVSWVLGDLRAKNAFYCVTELTIQGAILAQNHYNTAFGERTAFFDAITDSTVNLLSRSVTADRTEFFGRNGMRSDPAALKRESLSGRVGAGLDPCAAVQLSFNLAPNQSCEVVFILGAEKDKQAAIALIEKYHTTDKADEELELVRNYWHKTLTTVQVTTPDRSVNFMANGWLLYQVLSSRLWGRTGYYQSSGAFGFRDQLQDVMALAHAEPKLLRAHILLSAAHQFREGDVLHWWHPPEDRGVRTRCSDDYLWLPFVICQYIEMTGDKSILDETAPFLEGRLLKPDEESYYDLPKVSNDVASLYQHAVKAIQNGLNFGERGLPLMGSGDWNDGMNMVGEHGKGESIWLGFFLYTVLKQFALLAQSYGDEAFAKECDAAREKLQNQLKEHAWDGNWYRRAYFDDGTPLGTSSGSECQIDSIAQSWSVLSGAAESDRAKMAMDSLYERLVSSKDGVIRLLDPPFFNFTPSPGYIKGYVEGIRENGGQYTHAATWVIMAFAELGETQRAWECFNILNPIHHGSNAEQVEKYKIEPYVLAGDVYSVAPHVGRGGWSWYSGSAGWLYRSLIETLLGIHLVGGNQLKLEPKLPEDWNEFSVDYRYINTIYKIVIKRSAQNTITLDDVLLDGDRIPLTDDGQTHSVKINIHQ